jgi:hypothetical protein
LPRSLDLEKARCPRVHFEVSFQKTVTVTKQNYINECCWGGDVIREHFLPLISSRYEKIQTGQEDWGWFLWFRRDGVRLAIDIFCDNPATCEFRLRLYSLRRRFLFFHTEVDSPQLLEMKNLVITTLKDWGCDPKVDHTP